MLPHSQKSFGKERNSRFPTFSQIPTSTSISQCPNPDINKVTQEQGEIKAVLQNCFLTIQCSIGRGRESYSAQVGSSLNQLTCDLKQQDPGLSFYMSKYNKAIFLQLKCNKYSINLKIKISFLYLLEKFNCNLMRTYCHYSAWT